MYMYIVGMYSMFFLIEGQVIGQAGINSSVCPLISDGRDRYNFFFPTVPLRRQIRVADGNNTYINVEKNLYL